jgi:peptidoglycan/xylan/chitin deacetylase (PgdA/CDA1 family)
VKQLLASRAGRERGPVARHGASTTSGVVTGLAVFLLSLGCSFLLASHPQPEGTPGKLETAKESAGHSTREVVRGPRGKSQIALTFDAGAEAECFTDLIAALESAHVHSTFFITGKWAQQNKDCAAEITRRGHEVGNHTWNHLDLTKQPDDIVREEIVRAEVLLMQLSGQSPRPRWRAPYGARDERVLRIAANLGYKSIYWTTDSLDSADPPKTTQFLIDHITRQSDAQLDGAIILMHVGVRSTSEALPAIIGNLQGRGFQLVTVTRLLQRE